MRAIIISLASIVVLLMSNITLASENTPVEYCFVDSTISQMIVEIKQCRIIKEQVKDYETAISLLEEQIEKQKEVIELQKEVIKNSDEIIKQKDILLKEQKKTQPSFFEQLLRGMGFLGIGIVLGALL